MRFRDLDLFPKINRENNHQTALSGTITLFSCIFMAYLFITLTISFFFHGLKQRLVIDESPLPTDSQGNVNFSALPKLEITFDILLPSLPCPFLDFGVIDTFKEQQLDQFSRIKVKRFTKDGKKISNTNLSAITTTGCGSCYGMAPGCCNSCKDVRKAYKAKGIVPPPLATIKQCQASIKDYDQIKDEQCHIFGTLIAPQSKGIFYISPGDSYFEKTKQTADYLAMGLTLEDFNLTHIIKSFYFGKKDLNHLLDNVKVVQTQHNRFKGIYYLHAIREQVSRSKEIVYHYSMTNFSRYREGDSGKFPGLFFNYDVSPIIIQHKRDHSILRFLSNLIGILGGIYSLGVLLDRIIYKNTDNKAVSSLQ